MPLYMFYLQVRKLKEYFAPRMVLYVKAFLIIITFLSKKYQQLTNVLFQSVFISSKLNFIYDYLTMIYIVLPNLPNYPSSFTNTKYKHVYA